MQKNYWIIPCNPNYYDIFGAFDHLTTINWKQIFRNMKVDDIVYIYVGSPYKCIMYKTRINETNLPKVKIDDSEFQLNSESYKNYGNYLELERLETYNNIKPLQYHSLKVNGLTTVQGPTCINNQLKKYLEKVTNSKDEIQDYIVEYLKRMDYRTYNQSIKKELEKRKKFVEHFTIEKILNLNINEFATGRSTLDNLGKESFCYLIETQFKNLGEMRGSFASKFGIWYSLKDNQYHFTKKYGHSLESAFQKLKEEIKNLLIAGKQNDYESIDNNLLCPLFKGKILSIYFPDKYLCVFNKDDIELFLKELNIYYDPKQIQHLEQKKSLLLQYKNNNPYLKDVNNYYFTMFLYDTFGHKIKENKNKIQILGEIAYYNFEQVNFKYLGTHIHKKKSSSTSDTKPDYKKINENKKIIGDRGENAICNYEKQQLQNLGYQNLAKNVHKVNSDSLGYDVLSYHIDGTEKHIEVKTKSQNVHYIDFYLTDNELSKFENDDNHYIYYIFDLKNKNPKFTIIDKKEILQNKNRYLRPVLYKLEIDVEKIPIL